MTKLGMSRRQFLETAAGAGFAGFIGSATRAWGLTSVDNPLAQYPNRGWEHTYRDLWKYDSTFTFLCAPNDTHNCILNAYVRSGVISVSAGDSTARLMMPVVDAMKSAWSSTAAWHSGCASTSASGWRTFSFASSRA